MDPTAARKRLATMLKRAPLIREMKQEIAAMKAQGSGGTIPPEP